MRRTLALVGVVALIVLGAIVAVAMTRRPPGPEALAGAVADSPPRLDQGGRAVGRPLPFATLPALHGFGPDGGVDLPAGGGPMVVNFWASWCGPCVNEMPMLDTVADDLDIAVLGVDYVDQPDKAAALARRLDISYPLVRDDEGTFGERVGLIGTPTTLLVDPDGVVVRQLTGELSEAELRDAIAADLPPPGRARQVGAR